MEKYESYTPSVKLYLRVSIIEKSTELLSKLEFILSLSSSATPLLGVSKVNEI